MGTGLPRSVEVIVASAALFVVAPLIVISAILVLMTSRGGVLFKQTRIGQYGRRFTVLKLRSMTAGVRGPEVTMANDSRVTTVGRLLRAYKVDELPQFWNVIRGDMSLVGPRPEVPRYVDTGDPLWRTVLSARPGLSDPVTLELRNEEALLGTMGADAANFYTTTLVPYKLLGNAAYLRRRTWRTDLAVLLKTVRRIAVPNSTTQPTAAMLRSSVEQRLLESPNQAI